MTSPRTSPIAQPVRQCQVAPKAARFSDCGSRCCPRAIGAPTLTRRRHSLSQLVEGVVAERCDDLGLIEQPPPLLGSRPVPDVRVVEDLGQRPSAPVLAKDVASEKALAPSTSRTENRGDFLP